MDNNLKNSLDNGEINDDLVNKLNTIDEKADELKNNESEFIKKTNEYNEKNNQAVVPPLTEIEDDGIKKQLDNEKLFAQYTIFANQITDFNQYVKRQIDLLKKGYYNLTKNDLPEVIKTELTELEKNNLDLFKEISDDSEK
jgi:hypothetical protein